MSAKHEFASKDNEKVLQSFVCAQGVLQGSLCIYIIICLSSNKASVDKGEIRG